LKIESRIEETPTVHQVQVDFSYNLLEEPKAKQERPFHL